MRVRAARAFSKDPDPKYREELLFAYHKEDVPWVKKALKLALQQLEQKDSGAKLERHDLESSESTTDAADVEAIQSAAIDDSIGQILHEIEPLIGNLKVVARDEVRDFDNSKLRAEFNRLDDLLETFEDWRRVEQTPRYREEDIFRLVSQIAEDQQFSDVGVRVHVPDSLSMSTDRTLLRIIFSNALRNAVESTRNAEVDRRQPVVIAANATTDGMWASVLDRGIGLPAEEDVLLRSRQSTKPGHRGMGLVIVDKAVSALKGSWDLKNGSGGGAEFYFEIPAGP